MRGFLFIQFDALPLLSAALPVYLLCARQMYASFPPGSTGTIIERHIARTVEVLVPIFSV